MNVSPQPTMCPGGHQYSPERMLGSVTSTRLKPLRVAVGETWSSFSRSMSKASEPLRPFTSKAL